MAAIRPSRLLLVAVVAALLAACGSSATPTPSASSSPAASSGPAATLVPMPSSQLGNTTYGQAISGMTCDVSATHAGGVHAAISISITDGPNTIKVTPNLGMTDKCTYWLHADAAGNLVFDAPAGTALPTLNTLVTMWRLLAPQDPNFNSFVLGVVKGKISVNGVAATTSWQKINLADGAKIDIVAAPASVSSPSSAAPASASPASVAPSTSAAP